MRSFISRIFAIALFLSLAPSSMAEAASMRLTKRPKSRLKRPKSVLRLLDLEHSRNAVVDSLPAVSSQKSYGHAIDEFIAWYCSEPRLSFSRTVVLRYRIYLEQRNLAASTINVRLAAVRRLAYEAADNGRGETARCPTRELDQHRTGTNVNKHERSPIPCVENAIALCFPYYLAVVCDGLKLSD